jgi:hypothetical protein
MSIDFDAGPAVGALADRTAAFVRDVVVAAEPRDRGDRGEHGLDSRLRAKRVLHQRAAS